ncbi:MAG: hypothetical protein M1834_001653 [Cirrosporium novae-zelandiae]|nr:MAG: hypothetical protein M1834_004170 [Cirrosporium novae-zelandiae]KAI9735637.1 MAG: hypothetical protein M1834_001653 [Cirrosporium novae-zelandiae]
MVGMRWIGSGLHYRLLFKLAGLFSASIILLHTVENVFPPRRQVLVQSNFIPSDFHTENSVIADALDATSTDPSNSTDATQPETNTSNPTTEKIVESAPLLVNHPTIGKVTILVGDNPTYERAIKTHERHNENFGYPMSLLRWGILDDVWTKPAYILSVILNELTKPEEERLQWLLWFDADTIITNPNIPLDIFLPPDDFSYIHILLTNDWNGLNNGVFPIRVHSWSVELMSAVIAFKTYHPDVLLTFRDQSALSEVLKEPRFLKQSMYLPQRWFNAYQGEINETVHPFQARRGDMLVHFPGLPRETRDERMGLWLDRADKHLPEWEIDLIHTSYPSEVKEFWAGKRLELETDRNVATDARSETKMLETETIELLKAYQGDLTEADRSYLVQLLQIVSMTLQTNGQDVGALNAVTSTLQDVTPPLYPPQEIHIQDLINHYQQAIQPLYRISETHLNETIRDANRAILDAQTTITNPDAASHPDLISNLENKVKNLQGLMPQGNHNAIGGIGRWSGSQDIMAAIGEVKNASNTLSTELPNPKPEDKDKDKSPGDDHPPANPNPNDPTTNDQKPPPQENSPLKLSSPPTAGLPILPQIPVSPPPLLSNPSPHVALDLESDSITPLSKTGPEIPIRNDPDPTPPNPDPPPPPPPPATEAEAEAEVKAETDTPPTETETKNAETDKDTAPDEPEAKLELELEPKESKTDSGSSSGPGPFPSRRVDDLVEVEKSE